MRKSDPAVNGARSLCKDVGTRLHFASGFVCVTDQCLLLSNEGVAYVIFSESGRNTHASPDYRAAFFTFSSAAHEFILYDLPPITN